MFLNSFVRFPLLVIHLGWCVCTSKTVETARNVWPFQLNQWQLKSWILLHQNQILALQTRERESQHPSERKSERAWSEEIELELYVFLSFSVSVCKWTRCPRQTGGECFKRVSGTHRRHSPPSGAGMPKPAPVSQQPWTIKPENSTN